MTASANGSAAPVDAWAVTGKLRHAVVCDGRLLHLRLAAPPGNVLDRALIADLQSVLGEKGSEPGLRAVLLDHEGSHFSYGASVEEHLPGEVETLLPAFHALARTILDLPLPLVAAVRGRCLGGGLELASLAGRIFASADAKLGQPEIRLGVFAPLASALLPERIGPSAAEDLLLTGRVVAAEEACALGLVHAVTDDPAAAARAWVEEHLIGHSAFAVRLAARAARGALAARVSKRLAEVEALYLNTLMAGADPVEGLTAFLEKREPAWRNR
jgi:cyclohexa-1,5-dienecarbonyl-CoA hydratase